jgi:IMP dehydrogenase
MASIGQSLCFDDVLLEPLLSSTISRQTISLDINIGTNGRNLYLKTPLISSPMDTVTEKDMAIQMALNGGLGIIHRYMSIDEQVSQVKQVKRFLQYIIEKPYTIIDTATFEDLQKQIDLYQVSSFCVVDSSNPTILKGLITSRDIEFMKSFNDSTLDIKSFMTPFERLANYQIKTLDELNNIKYTPGNFDVIKKTMLSLKIQKMPIAMGDKLYGLITLKNIKHWENNKSKACLDSNGSLCVGSAIGITNDYEERLQKLVEANVDLICIDVANGFNTNIIKITKQIRQQYPNLVLMVGNVCNWQGFAELNKCDVDCIRVGVGNGSICTTRLETGIGKGQFSAVSECFDFINNKEVKNYKSNIICDGGSLGKTGNKVKALACGALAVMLGRTLASCEESPGTIIYRNGKRFKYIRGMASTMANLSKQEKTSDKKLKTNFTAEGVDGEQELTGKVGDLMDQIVGGLKSGLSYVGCETIQQLHEKRVKGEIKFNQVTSIGMSETGIRVKTY